MTSADSKKFVLNALERANILGIRKHPKRADFLDGKSDIDFSELEMDSLARMELCIYIEVAKGIEIAPDQFDEIRSLARLAEILEKDDRVV